MGLSTAGIHLQTKDYQHNMTIKHPGPINLLRQLCFAVDWPPASPADTLEACALPHLYHWNWQKWAKDPQGPHPWLPFWDENERTRARYPQEGRNERGLLSKKLSACLKAGPSFMGQAGLMGLIGPYRKGGRAVSLIAPTMQSLRLKENIPNWTGLQSMRPRRGEER